ncbi:oligosaccharide flippase family protein [Rhodocytophaga rosea]|uniref:Oligosaccharide flippase family protein n=1 Tax=Rhodocytophaga rosea TaxID=2704465 RepID=A0A6C0GCS5_9BACT|nr:oligosaccharide flippase family protein [Rhodocytophaga rosea]QHT65771.1 oligosaccharide flippase family protein [Rhodocytophaga rosea]
MFFSASTNRAYHWIKVISKFASVQIIAQGLNLISGLFIIRLLSKDEYSYYTIANTMVSMMNVLVSSGISISMTSIGGKIWKDQYKFSQLIITATQLRKYLAAIIIVAVVPVLIYMLYSNGAPSYYSILITIALLWGLYYELTAGIQIIILRLHSEIARIQNMELWTSFIRTSLILLCYFTYLNSLIAILIGSLALAIRQLWLSNWTNSYITAEAGTNIEYQQDIIRIIKHQFPSTLYYCFQAQIMIWLIGVFGKAENIAEVGALGRISVIYAIIGSVLNSIILPKFASCQEPRQLLQKYFQIILLYLSFCLSLLIASAFFPDQFLWVLGNKYAHLQKELVLISLSTVLSNVVGVMWSLNATRGWVKNSWFYIPITLLLQVFLLIYMDVSSLNGAILFGLISVIPYFCINIFLTVKGFFTFFKDSIVKVEKV